MRTIHRKPLAPASVATLDKMQSAVDEASTRAARVAKAAALWKAKSGTKPRAAAFVDVRAKLSSMANGRGRCMYCEDNLGTDIDHFRPKATHPKRAFQWDNYLLACSHCNSNEKRAEFPRDVAGAAMLLDPSVDEPADHLVLIPSTGYLVPVTPRGTETERVFGLNRRDELVLGRRDGWNHLRRIIRELGEAIVLKNGAFVATAVAEAKRLSFHSVAHYFVIDALLPSPQFVPKDLAATVIATQSAWAWAL